MTISNFRLPVRRFGVFLGALAMLGTSACDGNTAVDAVPDWGNGPKSPYVPEGYELTFEDNFNRRGADALLHAASTDTPSQKRQVAA